LLDTDVVAFPPSSAMRCLISSLDHAANSPVTTKRLPDNGSDDEGAEDDEGDEGVDKGDGDVVDEAGKIGNSEKGGED